MSETEELLYTELEDLQGKQLLAYYGRMQHDGHVYGVLEYSSELQKGRFEPYLQACLDSLLVLHSRGWLHNNLSPKAFCQAPNGRIVLAGLENACKNMVLHPRVKVDYQKRYRESVPNRVFCGEFLGSLNYGSMNLHLGYNPSVGTDLESLIYTFLEMRHNVDLPWATKKGTDDGIVARGKMGLLLGEKTSRWSGHNIQWSFIGELLYNLAISIHSAKESEHANRLFSLLEMLVGGCGNTSLTCSYKEFEADEACLAWQRGRFSPNVSESTIQRLKLVKEVLKDVVLLDEDTLIQSQMDKNMSLSKTLTRVAATGVEKEIIHCLKSRQVLGGKVYLSTKHRSFLTRRKMREDLGASCEIDFLGFTHLSSFEFMEACQVDPEVCLSLVSFSAQVKALDVLKDYEGFTSIMRATLMDSKEWQLYEKLDPQLSNLMSRDELYMAIVEMTTSREVDECIEKMAQLEADLLLLLCNLNEKGFPIMVHPLELCKLPVWGMVALSGKKSFSKILNNKLRKKIHEFPCCRVLAMQGSLLWGFFNSDKINNIFSLIQRWGGEVQNLLTETFINSEVSARACEVLLEKMQNVEDLETKVIELHTKVTELDSKVTELDSKLTTLDSKVINLDSKVINLDSKVTSLDTSLSELCKTVTTMSVKMEDLGQDIKQILGKLT